VWNDSHTDTPIKSANVRCEALKKIHTPQEKLI
jgi:hypothetical protein